MVFLASDYASYMTGEVVSVEQPACHDRTTAEPTATRRDELLAIAAEPVRRRRASATPPSATSPTRPASCPAASTTTSTPRSRWSTRSCRRSRRSCSGSTTRSWPATTTPATKLERAVAGLVRGDRPAPRRGRDLPERRGATSLTFERFGYLAERNAAVPRGLADAARRAASTRACSAPTSTSSSPTASSATPSGSRSPGTAPAAGARHTEIAEQYLLHPAGGDRTMPEAYIVDAVRTPVGKRGGALAGVHSADLGRAHAQRRWCDRTGIDPAAVDDVILGCCDTIGSQAGDVARTAWLVAGLPDHVPGVTIDRQCGSSQQAVHFAAQGVHVRHPGPRGRRRRAEHERDPDLRGDAGRPAVRLHHAVRRVARLAGAVRRPGGQPVPLAPR